MNLWLWFLFCVERFDGFWRWLGEGLDGQRRIFWPWAEDNQGLLSVAALATALVLFLIEQRRAIQAEARAVAADQAAERRFREENAENDRRQQLLITDADRRSREQAEEADRKAAKAEKAADRKAADAAARARDTSWIEFIDAVTGLVTPVIELANKELLNLQNLRPDDGYTPLQSSGLAWEVNQALQALLPAAPPSPKIILATQRSIAAVAEVHRAQNATFASGARNQLTVGIQKTIAVRAELQAARPPGLG